MKFWIGLIIGFLVGALFGAFIMCLMYAASDSDNKRNYKNNLSDSDKRKEENIKQKEE